MSLGKRSSGILDGDVSIFIRSTFLSFIILLVCAVVQAVYAIAVVDRRKRANLHQLPFVLVLTTSFILVVVYIMQLVSFSLFYNPSAPSGLPSISPGPGVVVVTIRLFQRLADLFVLSSLLSILDYRRMLFKRDTLFVLFKTYKKRIFDIATMTAMLIVILALTIMSTRNVPVDPRQRSDALSTVKGLEDAYIVAYVAVSLNVVITILYQWMQIIKIDSFRDESVLVLLRFASPVVILRAGFQIGIAIASGARGFEAPFDPNVFIFVVTLVDGLAYVALIIDVLCLDGKMAEQSKRLPEDISI